MAMVRGVRLPAIAVLALLPRARQLVADPPATASAAANIVAGLLVGMGLVVFAVVLSALVFGVYGWALFVFAPLLMGLSTGYLANRRMALSEGGRFKLV